jgi:O-antigen ligase
MGAIGMLMSGTRGAMIVPMGGLALYCLISKNVKITVTSALTVMVMYVFFAFTTIGDENAVIHRMRTAFRPSEDASMTARFMNQEAIAAYLQTHPLGAGLGKGISRVMEINGEFIENEIPPDSFYVDIWIQTGYTGLVLYVSIYIIVLLRCCYIVMFLIKDKQLRQILAAFVCGIFGIWLNGYVGEGMGLPPSNFLIPAMLAFILNGPYIDKHLPQQQQLSPAIKI